LFCGPGNLLRGRDIGCGFCRGGLRGDNLRSGLGASGFCSGAFFGCALVAQAGHALLRTRAFSYVPAGFGFGGCIGRAREGRTGKNEGENEDEEEPEPNCHCGHYHLVPGKLLLSGFPVGPEKPPARRIEGQSIRADAEIETYCDGKGNFPSRVTPNCPSTEVSTFLHQVIMMQPLCPPLRETARIGGLAAEFLVLPAGERGPESRMVLTLNACHLFCLKFKLTFLIFTPRKRTVLQGTNACSTPLQLWFFAAHRFEPAIAAAS
jgi:hypothetical protein